MKAVLQAALRQNGYHLDEAIEEKLVQFVTLLLHWNKVFRLTAITDPEEVVWLHLMDSLSIMPYVQGERIADVGSGGGLPGIPLALVFPEKKFVLIDSNGKKTRFLQQAILELKLTNTTVHHGRVEEWRSEEGFDCILTRAFSSLDTMLAQTGHLVRGNGTFLAMKGACPDAELANLPEGYKVTQVHRLSIDGLTAERHLVCLERE